MAKRDKDVITLGSGDIFLKVFDGEMPTVEDICQPENLLGWIKGGAALEYTEETYEEKDDLGKVSKIITTTEEAILKCGLLTWNGKTLEVLIDRCKVVEKDGKRIAKIGGATNSKGVYYVICFRHTDLIDGNVWVLIKGRNTAGVSLTFATDAGTVIEPEFKAVPHDEDGTLIQLVEEIPGTTQAPETPTPETPATYTITYDANGGTGEMTTGTATQGQAFTLPECEFTGPDGAQFVNWAVGSAEGTEVNAGDTFTFTADTTVYAVWDNAQG